jgi:hypothetical protein
MGLNRQLERVEEKVVVAEAARVGDADEAASCGGGNDKETVSSQQLKQKFPDGTLISIWFGHDGHQNKGPRYDGIIVGYDCFNLPSTTDKGSKKMLKEMSYSSDQFDDYINDQHYKRIRKKWRYMVQFSASNNARRTNGDSSTSSHRSKKSNNKSFIEFVSEDEIKKGRNQKKSSSENCAEFFVHKHFGTLRQDE